MPVYGFQKVIDPETQQSFWAYYHPNYFHLKDHSGYGHWVHDDCQTITAFWQMKTDVNRPAMAGEVV